jgi:hypothetical protein
MTIRRCRPPSVSRPTLIFHPNQSVFVQTAPGDADTASALPAVKLQLTLFELPLVVETDPFTLSMHLANQGFHPLGAFEREQVVLPHCFELCHHRIIAPLTVPPNRRRLTVGRQAFQKLTQARQRPPAPPPGSAAGTTGREVALIPDTTTLGGLLRHHLHQLKYGQAEGEEAVLPVRGVTADLLRRLMRSWGMLTERSFKREQRVSHAEVVLGLAAVHQVLSTAGRAGSSASGGAVSAEPPGEATPGQALRPDSQIRVIRDESRGGFRLQ